jgi:hypothetical protein
VPQGPPGDLGQEPGVAGVDGRALAGDHPNPHDQAHGGQDVALLAVGVMQERDAGATVRVVLDGRDLGRDVAR